MYILFIVYPTGTVNEKNCKIIKNKVLRYQQRSIIPMFCLAPGYVVTILEMRFQVSVGLITSPCKYIKVIMPIQGVQQLFEIHSRTIPGHFSWFSRTYFRISRAFSGFCGLFLYNFYCFLEWIIIGFNGKRSYIKVTIKNHIPKALKQLILIQGLVTTFSTY